MTKALLFAVAALVFGVLAVVVPDRLFPPEMNYRTISTFGEAFRGFILGSFRFAMGAFAGLALVAGLASLGGVGARRPVALVVSSLFAIGVIAVSGFAFRGFTHFPAGGSLEERHRWAEMRLDRPYRAVAVWVAASSALREALGEALGFGPFRHGSCGSMEPAQVEKKIDRIAGWIVEDLGGTAEQQARLAAIAKAAAKDLAPVHDELTAGRRQAVEILTAPQVDRAALEAHRARQMQLVTTASERLTVAVADAAEVLTPEQRVKAADRLAGHMARFGH